MTATEKAKGKRCGNAHFVLSLGALHGKVAVQEGGEVREVAKRDPVDGDTLGQPGILAPENERRSEHKKEGIKTKGRGGSPLPQVLSDLLGHLLHSPGVVQVVGDIDDLGGLVEAHWGGPLQEGMHGVGLDVIVALKVEVTVL